MPTDLKLLADRMFDHGSAWPVDLAPGEELIEEGDGADTVYVLLTGTLEVAKKVGDDDALLAVIDQPGDLIGEIVSLGGGTRTARVTARTASELVAIGADGGTAGIRGLRPSARGLARVDLSRGTATSRGSALGSLEGRRVCPSP